MGRIRKYCHNLKYLPDIFLTPVLHSLLLEEELNVKLLERHNRTFSLTPAGEHFYRKSLVLTSDITQMLRETKRFVANDNKLLRIGYYKGYNGNELSEFLYFQKNIRLLMFRSLSEVMNQTGQKEEQEYYETIIGLHGEFLFADTIQEARLKIVTGQGYMPVDVIDEQSWFDTTVSRLPLTRNGESVKKPTAPFGRKQTLIDI